MSYAFAALVLSALVGMSLCTLNIGMGIVASISIIGAFLVYFASRKE